MNKLKILFLSIIIGLLTATVVFAWTNPSANPPSGGGALYYSGGNVGIGTASPQRKLHILGSDGAVTSFPTVGAKDFLIIENNGNTNIAVVSSATGEGAIKFYDSGATAYRGVIDYSHSGDYLWFGTAGAEKVRIDSTGKLTAAGTVESTSGGFKFPDGTIQTTASTGSAIPRGVIVMWSGTIATIPSGWALCDGTNSTPDLRDKFIYGASAGENPGATGGSTTHSHLVPDHYHVVDPPNYSSQTDSALDPVGPHPQSGQLDTQNIPSLNHYHYFNVDIPAFNSGSTAWNWTCTAYGYCYYSPYLWTESVSNLPPYYKLAFIMKL